MPYVPCGFKHIRGTYLLWGLKSIRRAYLGLLESQGYALIMYSGTRKVR